MGLRLDTVVFRTPFETFTVELTRTSASPTPQQLESGRFAAEQIRFGLDLGEPAMVRAALELDRLLTGGSFVFSPVDRSDSVDLSFGGLSARLERALLDGSLSVERTARSSLTDRRTFELPELPPLPPAPREVSTQTFEVRFIDEIGKAISGIEAEFVADGPKSRSTNAAGIALLEGVNATSASVAVVDVDALSKLLDPRWEAFRPGKPPKESNTQEIVFRGSQLGPFALKAEVPNTVVVKPPLGKLFVELWDKTGRVRHSNRTYRITGPQTFEGSTDDEGRLVHESVFPGDYQLSLALDFFEQNAPDRAMDVVDSALVVLEPSAAVPQVRLIGAVPRSILARLQLFFNTNKAFLLPTALPGVKKLRELYADSSPCKLLVVGHADTKGSTAYNDQLSLKRAEATIAYLEDDVEGWYAFYSPDIDVKQRWGKVEDHLMILAMPDFFTKPQREDRIEFYQRTRGLKVDGTAGQETRRALIKEYMSLDGASLSELVGEIEAVAHGCGESFPLDDTGENLDTAPVDQKRDPIDRRVELFFFDEEFGITPPPPGNNSKAGSREYPLWRQRVAETIELRADELNGPKVTFVELADAHFRTGSAVLLPEGEDPDQGGEHQALTSVGLIATALRFNEERPGLTVVVAGHTDTIAGDALNDEVSKQRAKVALALLEGDREAFKTLCHGRNKPADINQILSWVSRAFDDLVFDCAPGSIVDVVDDKAVRQFQSAFSENRDELGSSSPELVADGTVGPLTWGAFFDCYELALQRELGEDADGVRDLRGKLTFADPGRKSLGVGERVPIEELGVDNFRSQTNRRVEVLFFEPGEEPDLAHAESDPDTSELYLPGFFQRSPLDAFLSAKLADRAIGIRVPMRFSKNKSFPKPGALPALQAAIELMQQRPELSLVIVGHTDPVGADTDNQALSLARAEAVRAWLTGDVAFFNAQLASTDQVRGWSWEELQWMLYGARDGALPHYIGQADGSPGDRTEDALGAFQLGTEDLPVSYAADRATVDRVVDAYLALLGGVAVDPRRVEVVGAGGWHPPERFAGGAELPAEIDPRELRRVELLFFAQPPRPPVARFPRARAKPTVYRGWCRQVGEEIVAERGPYHLQAYDPAGVPLPQTTLELAQIIDDQAEVAIGATTTDETGKATLTVAPGVYAAQIQLGGGAALIAALTVDPDTSCGAALSFRLAGGIEPLRD